MNTTADLEELVPWQRGPIERGGYSIIFACLAVVVTSTWTALHLNLPGLERVRRRREVSVFLFGKLRWITIFPAVDWTTLRKTKWTFVMVVFPVFVFAHTVLELRMALDDYIKMDEEHVAMHKKGWCIEARSWEFVLHDFLQDRWPAIKISYSSKLPWFRVASKRKREDCKANHGDEENVPFKAEDNRPPVTAAPPTVSGSPEPTGQITGVSANESSETSIAAVPSSENIGTPTLAHSSPDDFGPRQSDEDFSTGHPVMCLEMNLPKWTLTHTYFANMGGITFNGSVVPADYLARTLSVPSGAPSQAGQDFWLMTAIGEAGVSESQIVDKGKADLLLRLLWIWQILWLWVELSTRAALRLPVNQLEIITLSFSVISILIHIIQGSKPKDVAEPIDVKHGKIGRLYALTTLESITSAYLSYSPPGNHRDRIFRYRVPNDVFREEHQGLLLVMLTASTILFGLIHCGAWNFNFPTAVEQWFWRACALSGIVLSLIMVLLAYLSNRSLRNLDEALNAAQKDLEASIRTLASASGKDFRGKMWIYWRQHQSASKLAEKVKSELSYRRSSTDLSAEVKDLDEKAAEVDQRTYRRRDLMSHRRYYQIPAVFVYLVTRVAIITLAFTAFRKAPRGIYKDTWAAFVPTFQ